MWLSADHIIQAGGLLAIGLVIFAEGALLIGLFLPGDTLLIPAGIWASHHGNQLNIGFLLPTVIVASVAGYQVGYLLGERTGPRVFKRSGGILFRADYIPRTEAFLKQHGGKAILAGRFIAVVRTLLPIMAGIGKMPKRRFLFFNISGGVLWCLLLV
ncbi:MAG TPA: VTT domain-containing protein, partial [Candidatus Saccharimonadales bacterium]|nr:VTT domain-containing protein [Candidatus Saccharimonadales bacterium]